MVLFWIIHESWIEKHFGTRTNTDGHGLDPRAGLLDQRAALVLPVLFRVQVEDTLTVGRRTRIMSVYQFVLAMVLGA